nr:T9SS type A sorting domain-containing protein [Flavobacteriales bacterium]
FRSMGGLSTGLNGISQEQPKARVRDGQLELTFFHGHQGASAVIFDPMGRVVKRLSITGSSSTVDISSFGPGAYSLSVATAEGPIVRRFVKD